MRAFKLIEMDGALVVAIADSELAACIRALDYTWGHKASSQSVVAQLHQVLNERAAAAAKRPARKTAKAEPPQKKEPPARSAANGKPMRGVLPASMH